MAHSVLSSYCVTQVTHVAVVNDRESATAPPQSKGATGCSRETQTYMAEERGGCPLGAREKRYSRRAAVKRQHQRRFKGGVFQQQLQGFNDDALPDEAVEQEFGSSHIGSTARPYNLHAVSRQRHIENNPTLPCRRHAASSTLHSEIKREPTATLLDAT